MTRPRSVRQVVERLTADFTHDGVSPPYRRRRRD